MARSGFMVLVIVLLVSKPAISSAVSDIKCGQVLSLTAQCLRYVEDKDNQPPQDCCKGVKQLGDLCKTKQDRQAACECLKKKTTHLKIDYGRVLALPQKCGITPSYYGTDAADIDCSNIPAAPSSISMMEE